MTIATLLCAGDEGAAALSAPGRAALSFGALRRHVDDTVQALNGFGIGRADRIAIVLPDGAELATAFLGAASAAIAAPLNPRYTAAEFDFFLTDLKPKAVLVETGRASPAIAVARRLQIPIIELVSRGQGAAGLFELKGDSGVAAKPSVAAPDDRALLLHTSGTTARPKLVPLTHRQLCVSAGNVAAALALTPADRGLHIMPLFHIHGLVAGLLAPLQAGGSLYCTPGLDMAAFSGWLSEARPSWLTAVPTMHQAILEWARREPDAARRASLRFIRSCSAALAPSIARALEAAFGAPVVEAYAMTEAAHQISCNPLPPGVRSFGSVGVAAGPRIAILDPAGTLLPPGETGEVAIRGDNVMTGYDENPQADALAFTNGWFRTGDLGVLGDDGYLRLNGRLKEQINRGGEKISPAEIENVLLAHAAVAQAVAFAVPHRSLGEEVGAAVVLREGASVTAGDLKAHAAGQLSLPKIPRRILFQATLPKGPTGKLRRIGLAKILGLDAVARPAFIAPRSPLERDLADIWQRALAIPDIGVTDDFFDLGGNSIAALQIATEILRRTRIDVPLTQFLHGPTIADLALTITERQLLDLAPETFAALMASVEDVESESA